MIKKPNFLYSFLLSILFPFIGMGQYQFPEPGFVFDDTSIPIVKISIPEESLEKILEEENLDDNTEYLASFEFIREDQSEQIDSIGFRLRGNTSRESGKKSFKVSFNSFVPGRRYHGLDKLNLNGEHNDPSIMRAKLCWDFMQYAGIPSSRSNHVLLYINEEFRGIYLNVEHVDEEFIDKRFENDQGNLYKCLYPADLLYKGENPDVYKEEIYGRRAYDLKTNKNEDDYTDLAHFIYVLNNLEGSELQCELEKIFDVENYLRVMAVDILISNWDGPIVNKNNFYLYSDPETGKITYVPYDLDNTLGIGWGSVDWANTDIYEWNNSWGQAERPLYEGIIAVPEYRDKLSFYIQSFIDRFFNVENLDSYLNLFRQRLSEFRPMDEYAGWDYGYDFSDFWESFDHAQGGHVLYGIKEYINERNQSALDQLDSYSISGFVKHYSDRKTINKLHLEIEFYEVLSESDTLFINYQIGEGPFINEVFNSEDKKSFTTSINHSNEGTLRYYYRLSSTNFSRSWPYCGFEEKVFSLDLDVGLVINEILASNEDDVPDNKGEYEDWIELYNRSQDTLILDGYYLTDNEDNPGKWNIPYETLDPGNYLTFFADEDPVQGENHTNFKLSRNGEFLGIYKKVDDLFIEVDNLIFPSLEVNQSFGRLPNGTGEHTFLPYTTFGYNNEGPEDPLVIEEINISLYPNPTTQMLNIFFENSYAWNYIRITDIMGRTMYYQENFTGGNMVLDLFENNFSAGVYVITGMQIDKSKHSAKFIFLGKDL